MVATDVTGGVRELLASRPTATPGQCTRLMRDVGGVLRRAGYTVPRGRCGRAQVVAQLGYDVADPCELSTAERLHFAYLTVPRLTDPGWPPLFAEILGGEARCR